MSWTVNINGGPRFEEHCAARVGDRIFAFGLRRKEGDYVITDPAAMQVFVLDTNTCRWCGVVYEKSQFVPNLVDDLTAVVYGTKIYILQCCSGRNNHGQIVCFDAETFEWKQHETTGRSFEGDGYSACVIDNKLYLFGGYMRNVGYSNNVYCLYLDTMEWRYINANGDPPSPRDNSTAMAVGDKIYIFGGCGEMYRNEYCDLLPYFSKQIHCFDTVSKTWLELKPSGKKPKGRRSHRAWVHDNFIYIFGGYRDISRKYLQDLHRYSITNNSWERVKTYGKGPSARKCMEAIVHVNKVFVFGGNNSGQMYSNSGSSRDCTFDNLHVLDYKPTLKTFCMLTILKNNLDQKELPSTLRKDIENITMPNLEIYSIENRHIKGLLKTTKIQDINTRELIAGSDCIRMCGYGHLVVTTGSGSVGLE